jgi:hypothetical protein
MLQLTESNYYSIEADRELMSNSQFSAWRECEEQEYERIFHGWKKPPSTPDLVGQFFHAAFEGEEAFAKFQDDNAEEIIAKSGKNVGQPKAEYRTAFKMIDVAKNDPMIHYAMTGQKEVIIVANWLGIPWKIRIDNLNRDGGYMADLKSCKDLYHREWSEEAGRKVHFIEHYGYLRQFGIYSQIESIDAGRDSWLDFFGVFVSKQEQPDKIVLAFNPETLRDHLDYVEKQLPRVLAVKSGKERPRRCERCLYCRETKQLRRPIDYDAFLDYVHFGTEIER